MKRVIHRSGVLASLSVLAAVVLTGTAEAQLGSGWVLYSPTKRIHLDDDAGLQTFTWTSYKSVCSPTICADYSYDSATDTETFRILDSRSNRSEIRLQNEYSSGSRQFQGYVTFFDPLHDESLFQIFGNTGSSATFLMMRGYRDNGGTIRVMGGSHTIATGIYGVEVRINIIHQHNVSARFYVNGSFVHEKAHNDPGVTNYHKYGCYGTTSGNVPAVVKWRAARSYRDGQAPGSLPSPWLTADIGSVGATGNALHSSGVFNVFGSGADIWGTADAFRYVYQPVTGDCDIRARVDSVENTHAWAKSGVMIRESLNSNSKHASVYVTPGSGVSFQRRTATGGSSASTSTSGITAPRWVRVTRTGSTLTGYHSSDGSTWTSIGSETISMASTVYVGLPVTSHVQGTLCLATFSNVAVIQGVAELFQHTSYGGWRAGFGLGNYNTAALTAAGGVNNDASSIKVPAGYRVTLYDGDNFTGNSIVKTANDTSLIDDGFNDVVSSLKVEAN